MILTYRYTPERRLRRPPKIDVRLPTGPGPHPSVLVAHGGGFVGGWRRMRAVTTLARALPEAGIAVGAFDYRLAFRGGRFDEGVEDTLAALAWWRQRTGDFALDPDRIGLVGISAGAALATAAAPRAGPLYRVAGVYGPYDFTHLPFRPRRLARWLLLGTGDPAAWARRSPARSCDVDAPLALLHGVEDGLIDLHHTLALEAFRREHGLPVQTHLYDGVGHGFLRHPDWPQTRRAVDDLVAFLRG